MKIDTTFAVAQSTPSVADAAVQLPKEDKLAKTCDQFEGMLVRQILSEGLKPLLAQPPGSGAAGAGVYDYMVTDNLANSISGKNAMGISHLLQTQLTPRASVSQSAHHP